MLMLQVREDTRGFFDIFLYERAGYVLLDPLGTATALAVVLLIGAGVANTRLPQSLKNLIYAALILRVVGAAARYIVLFGVYRGSGDARHYYSRGLDYAAGFWQLDFAPLFDPSNWWGGKWWGTQFVYFPSSFVLSFIGPSMPGGFIIFSLLAFTGLTGFAVAFARTYPDVPVTRYARWIWLFPALWYWPSSIGKEAIVIFGLGLAVMGYVGRGDRINWILLIIGTFFVFAIRPQVAAVVILSMVIAHWLSLPKRRWTLGTTLQAAGLIGGGVAGIWLALHYAGMGGFDVEGVHSYLEDNKARDVGGGSEIEAARVGVAGIPLALVNILVRPFLWESRSLMMLITSLEIMGFWAIVWLRRENVLTALRNWRSDKLLRVAIPFILIYSVTLGMVMGNMAIIARQRIFLFPFLFLLVEAAPRIARSRSRPPARDVDRPLPNRLVTAGRQT